MYVNMSARLCIHARVCMCLCMYACGVCTCTRRHWALCGRRVCAVCMCMAFVCMHVYSQLCMCIVNVYVCCVWVPFLYTHYMSSCIVRVHRYMPRLLRVRMRLDCYVYVCASCGMCTYTLRLLRVSKSVTCTYVPRLLRVSIYLACYVYVYTSPVTCSWVACVRGLGCLLTWAGTRSLLRHTPRHLLYNRCRLSL